MFFSSTTFLFCFLPVVLIAYYSFFEKSKHKNTFLLLSSLVFYTWGEPVFVILLLLSIFINFVTGTFLQVDGKTLPQKQRRFILGVGLSLNLIMLFYFKYEGFYTEVYNTTLGQWFHRPRESLHLILPIGISFFTFQGMSYLIDVSKGEIPPQENFIDLALYIAFFPQLVAGPIVQYSEISHELQHRKLKYREIDQGIKRFIIGLSKKIIFSNQLALIVGESFSHENPSFLLAWLGGLCYSLQIYFDFSGYSDMAIGLGLMFGFHFPENFNYPCISKTITEFWRRHHISLGRWFRQYLYFPLGGSKVSKKRLVLNLFLVWLATGLWHGASPQFLVWGLLFFCLMTFEKLLEIPSKIQGKLIAIPYHLFTIVMIIVSWVIFGEASLEMAVHHLNIMFHFHKEIFTVDQETQRLLTNYGFFLQSSLLCATPIFPKMFRWIKKYTYNENTLYLWETTSAMSYIFLLLVSISYLVIGLHNPFIYFNF